MHTSASRPPSPTDTSPSTQAPPFFTPKVTYTCTHQARSQKSRSLSLFLGGTVIRKRHLCGVSTKRYSLMPPRLRTFGASPASLSVNLRSWVSYISRSFCGCSSLWAIPTMSDFSWLRRNKSKPGKLPSGLDAGKNLPPNICARNKVRLLVRVASHCHAKATC